MVGVIVLSVWPALWNGSPFLSTDTIAYVRAADAGIHQFLKAPSLWAGMEDAGATASASQVSNHPHKLHSLEEASSKGIILGRSIYYGVLLYLGLLAGSFWLTILLQAGSILLAIALTLRSLKWPLWPYLSLVCLALALLSDAPFFASLLLPDLFAGIAILGCAVLFLCGGDLSLRLILSWYLLLAAALLFSDSVFALGAALIGCALLVNLLHCSWRNLRGVVVVALALLTAAGGQTLFQMALQHTTGAPAIRMPHLTACLIGTEYGTRYVRTFCPGSGFAVCQFAQYFPEAPRSFIWGDQSKPGAGFADAPLKTRVALAAENLRFGAKVFQYAPAAFVTDAIRNSFKQLVSYQFVDEFDYGPGQRQVMDKSYPPAAVALIRHSLAYGESFPEHAMTVGNYLLTLAALGYLLTRLLFMRTKLAAQLRLYGIVLWVFAGIVTNAAICGVLSDTVAPRYTGRVVWLLPLLAFLIEMSIRRERSAERESADESAQSHALQA